MQAAHEVGKELAATGIGPVEVIQHEEQRCAFTDGIEQFKRGLPQAQLLLFW